MKTSELTGAQLDWSVAKCEGELDECGYYINDYTGAFMLEQGADIAAYCPSTLWNHGGPIIEQEEISVEPQYSAGGLECWVAYGHNLRYDDHGNYIQGSDNRKYGPTPLVAAMRCYVASKLGEYVDVPF